MIEFPKPAEVKSHFQHLAILCFLILAACPEAPINPVLAADGYATGTNGYRYNLFAADADNTDDLFVVLAFSGGGTRAAALSYGVLE